MKKTLLAAALMAGFAGIAQAETSVTLYGIIDTGIGYDRVKDGNGNKATRTGMIDGVQSGNRWGLKGSEDLGNGLRANFQLESGYNLTQGRHAQNDRLFGRHATLGLSGDSWGRIDFGRQQNLASQYYVDVHGNVWDSTGSGQAFRSTDTVRLDNTVIYQTPNFSGFQAGVGYSFQANGVQSAKFSGQKDQNNSALTTGLRYANGPIATALTYERLRGADLAAGGTPGNYNKFKDQSAWTLSGSYDFEVVKLGLAFGQEFDGAYGTGYGKNHDYNNYAVSLAAPVGAGNVSGAYSLSQPRKDAKRSGEVKQHAFSLAYTYPFSKRTNVYAMGGYTKNADNVKDLKRTVAGVGLRHQF